MWDVELVRLYIYIVASYVRRPGAASRDSLLSSSGVAKPLQRQASNLFYDPATDKKKAEEVVKF
jgi:hypothetical protein